MVGIDLRNTLDMDATIKGFELSEVKLNEILNEIIQIDVDDDVSFEIVMIKNIRDEADYLGYRVTLNAKFQTIIHNFRIDITTGDTITPSEIEYEFDLLFEDRKINVLAYNLETIISEKFETIISRSTANTRARDFYDLYIIQKLQSQNYNKNILKKAIINKFNSRETQSNLEQIDLIINTIETDDTLKKLWNNYRRDYFYAEDITYEETILAVKEIANIIK